MGLQFFGSAPYRYFFLYVPLAVLLYRVYRRKIAATQCWRDYLLYVAFFPQLVAGPIVRWSTIGEQLTTPRPLEKSNVGLGLVLMTIGLFQKIVLADAVFAPVANSYFGQDFLQTGIEAWVASLAFSGQIFCDFAGYTTCAIGAALVLGFHLPVNFQAPYASRVFQISGDGGTFAVKLAKDYLYISLGGNRVRRIRVLLNLMITMLLGVFGMGRLGPMSYGADCTAYFSFLSE